MSKETNTNTNAIQALIETGDKAAIEFANKLKAGEPFLFEITPTLAMHIRTCCGGKNRPVSQAHMNRLAAAMRGGEWRFNNAAIGFYEDGKLSDGQHRLYACTEADYTMKTIVVPNMDRDAMLTVDQQTKARKTSDFLSMDGVEKAEDMAYIATQYLKKTNSPRGNFTGPSPSNTAVMRYIEAYGDKLEDYLKEAEKLTKDAAVKFYSVRKVALWLFIADKDSPHFKELSRKVIREILTGTAETEGAPGLMAHRVLTDIFGNGKKGVSRTMNTLIGTTIKALNLEIAGQVAGTPRKVLFPVKKGERFPVITA